jgi:uncharacterized protein YbaP (TraB family)
LDRPDTAEWRVTAVQQVLAIARNDGRAAVGFWCTALCALLLFCGPPAAAGGLFYQVSNDKGRAWLLGSLHFGAADMYPLPQPIERAFAGADRLIVEANIRALDTRAVAAAIEKLGLFAGDGRLRSHLPDALWQRLSAASEQVGVSLSSLERQRPWLAAMTLTAALVQSQGLYASQGVDLHFLDRANRWQIPIVELEGFEQQMRILSDIGGPDQLQMLESAIDALERDDRMAQDLLAAWRASDGERVQRLLQETFGRDAASGRLQLILLNQRNGPMARRIGEQINLGGTVFVVLGAAHLFGPQNVPDQLRRLGFSVRSY